MICNNSDVTQHKLFFDNVFFSYKLLTSLASQSISAVGAVRENRINQATQNMKLNKELKRSRRGLFVYRFDRLVYVAKWNNNLIVHVCSNYSPHEPLHKCKRRAKGSTLKVPQPHLISTYNKGMSSVDLLAHLSASYRPSIKGKKWY